MVWDAVTDFVTNLIAGQDFDMRLEGIPHLPQQRPNIEYIPLEQNNDMWIEQFPASVQEQPYIEYIPADNIELPFIETIGDATETSILDSILVATNNNNDYWDYDLPSTVQSPGGITGHFSDSRYTYRIDTHRVRVQEGGFHIHVYFRNREVAKINGRGGWEQTHGSNQNLSRPRDVPAQIRRDINRLVRHVQRNLQ